MNNVFPLLGTSDAFELNRIPRKPLYLFMIYVWVLLYNFLTQVSWYWFFHSETEILFRTFSFPMSSLSLMAILVQNPFQSGVEEPSRTRCWKFLRLNLSSTKSEMDLWGPCLTMLISLPKHLNKWPDHRSLALERLFAVWCHRVAGAVCPPAKMLFGVPPLETCKTNCSICGQLDPQQRQQNSVSVPL